MVNSINNNVNYNPQIHPKMMAPVQSNHSFKENNYSEIPNSKITAALRGVTFGSNPSKISQIISKYPRKPDKLACFRQLIRENGKVNYTTSGFWKYSSNKVEEHSPWKMHLYATTPEEWDDVAKASLPYLQENNILHKTVSNLNNIGELNVDAQKGKAFTVYPRNEDEFKKVAKFLDSKMKENNLQMTTSNIEGDKKLGDTGRIFYRYEGTSKSNSAYDANRGANHYMPADMTEKDDPFHNIEL